MDIDLIMRITAMLDEEKTYKIMKRQLADVQKKLQGQSQISVSVKVNDKAAKQQTHKLWGSLKEKIEKKPVSIKKHWQNMAEKYIVLCRMKMWQNRQKNREAPEPLPVWIKQLLWENR